MKTNGKWWEICENANGNEYKGEWINDKKNGEGVLTYAQNLICKKTGLSCKEPLSGTWKDNEFKTISENKNVQIILEKLIPKKRYNSNKI